MVEQTRDGRGAGAVQMVSTDSRTGRWMAEAVWAEGVFVSFVGVICHGETHSLASSRFPGRMAFGLGKFSLKLGYGQRLLPVVSASPCA